MENHIILYVYEYSDVIKLPKSYSPPPPMVGRGYRLSNFWLAKEVKKKLQQQCL
jgi:hypothetical protein